MEISGRGSIPGHLRFVIHAVQNGFRNRRITSIHALTRITRRRVFRNAPSFGAARRPSHLHTFWRLLRRIQQKQQAARFCRRCDSPRLRLQRCRRIPVSADRDPDAGSMPDRVDDIFIRSLNEISVAADASEREAFAIGRRYFRKSSRARLIGGCRRCLRALRHTWIARTPSDCRSESPPCHRASWNKPGSVDVSLEREQAIGSARIQHFVKRQADDCRSAPFQS